MQKEDEASKEFPSIEDELKFIFDTDDLKKAIIQKQTIEVLTLEQCQYIKACQNQKFPKVNMSPIESRIKNFSNRERYQKFLDEIMTAKKDKYKNQKKFVTLMRQRRIRICKNPELCMPEDLQMEADISYIATGKKDETKYSRNSDSI